MLQERFDFVACWGGRSGGDRVSQGMRKCACGLRARACVSLCVLVGGAAGVVVVALVLDSASAKKSARSFCANSFACVLAVGPWNESTHRAAF